MLALVRRPGPRLADGIVTHLSRTPVDVELARAQHDAYVAALTAHGVDPVFVRPADEQPDAPFVEDTVVIVDRLAVLTRPGAPERRPEIDGTAEAVTALGYRTVSIEAPGTLDGGDILQVGDTIYAGRSARSNRTGIAQLADHLRPLGRTVVPVDVAGVLHLKSAVTALPTGGDPNGQSSQSSQGGQGSQGSQGGQGSRGVLIGRPEHVDLPGLLVPPEPAGAHVLPLSAETVLISAAAPDTAALLRERGLRPVPVDISEFEKLEGCVTCLSVLLP